MKYDLEKKNSFFYKYIILIDLKFLFLYGLVVTEKTLIEFGNINWLIDLVNQFFYTHWILEVILTGHAFVSYCLAGPVGRKVGTPRPIIYLNYDTTYGLYQWRFIFCST